MADPLPQGPPPGPAASRPDPRRTRRMLLLIGAITVAPVLASYGFYYFGPRDARVNYGTLLPTEPAPALEGLAADGGRFRLADLSGRWLLVVPVAGRCDAVCERSLYATRQARTMQGKEQDRVVRVLLVPDGEAPGAALLEQHPGLVVARVAPAAQAALPEGGTGIYLVDPLGNLVLQYPADPDIKGVSKDLVRLLKASGIG